MSLQLDRAYAAEETATDTTAAASARVAGQIGKDRDLVLEKDDSTTLLAPKQLRATSN